MLGRPECRREQLGAAVEQMAVIFPGVSDAAVAGDPVVPLLLLVEAVGGAEEGEPARGREEEVVEVQASLCRRTSILV